MQTLPTWNVRQMLTRTNKSACTKLRSRSCARTTMLRKPDSGRELGSCVTELPSLRCLWLVNVPPMPVTAMNFMGQC